MKYIYDSDIWEFYKRDGLVRFIVRHYLAAGLIIGLVFPIIIQLFSFYAFGNPHWEAKTMIIWHISSLFGFSGIFILYGYLKWKILDKRFKDSRKF